MIKILALIGIAIGIVGCSSVKIDNRVVCTVDRTKAYVVGDISTFSATLPLSDKDAAAICGSIPVVGK